MGDISVLPDRRSRRAATMAVIISDRAPIELKTPSPPSPLKANRSRREAEFRAALDNYMADYGKHQSCGDGGRALLTVRCGRPGVVAWLRHVWNGMDVIAVMVSRGLSGLGFAGSPASDGRAMGPATKRHEADRSS